MPVSNTSLYASAAIGSLVVLWMQWRSRVSDLPPGPTKLPVIGNLLNMPKKLEGRKLAAMAEELDSDIIQLEAFGTSLVVLNSREAVEELLEKRSGIYSSRPKLPMFNLSGWGSLFIIWPYGEQWRKARKVFTQCFSSTAIHRPREVTYVNALLKRLLEDPSGYFNHIRHLTGSISLEMTYGIKVESTNDPYVNLVEAGAVDSTAIVAETYLVDVFPFLKYLPQWFPGASFQKQAARSRALAARVLNEPFAASEAMVKSGVFESALVTSGLDEINQDGGDRELLKLVAGMVFLAGSDTTTSALGTFFLAMVLHPEIQRKIQDELDSVLHGALPRHEDLESLPYLEAVILEALRWRPVLPLGVAHSIESDDVYGQYRIPAGSVIFANQWAILHDERDYPEPDTFKPERFFKNGKVDKSVKSPLDIAFGSGRRLCPGRHIGISILMLTGASVLSVFNLTKKKDEQGNPIEPSGEYHESALAQPLEFPCVITPRSPHAIELIHALAHT